VNGVEYAFGKIMDILFYVGAAGTKLHQKIEKDIKEHYRKMVNMLCMCEKCNKFKLWFNMIHEFGYTVCKQCVEEIHAKIDAKIKKALGV